MGRVVLHEYARHILEDKVTMMASAKELFKPLSTKELEDARLEVLSAVVAIDQRRRTLTRKVERMPKGTLIRYNKLLDKINDERQLLSNLKKQRKERQKDKRSTASVTKQIFRTENRIAEDKKKWQKLRKKAIVIRVLIDEYYSEIERCHNLCQERDAVLDWLELCNMLNQSPELESRNVTEQMQRNRVMRCFLQSGIKTVQAAADVAQADELVFKFIPNGREAAQRNRKRLLNHHRNELNELRLALKNADEQNRSKIMSEISRTEKLVEDTRALLKRIDISKANYEDNSLLDCFYMFTRRYIFNCNPAPMLREMRLVNGDIYITVKRPDKDNSRISNDAVMANAMIRMNLDYDYGYPCITRDRPKGYLLTKYDEEKGYALPAWKFTQAVLDTIPEYLRIKAFEVREAEYRERERKRTSKARKNNNK